MFRAHGGTQAEMQYEKAMEQWQHLVDMLQAASPSVIRDPWYPKIGDIRQCFEKLIQVKRSEVIIVTKNEIIVVKT